FAAPKLNNLTYLFARKYISEKKDVKMIYYQYMKSPVGKLLVAGNNKGLHLISFPKGNKRSFPEAHWVENQKPLIEVLRQLEAYFAGKLKAFSLDICLNVTPFQKKVLTALRQVPYGETISYGELAKNIGNSKASRAVGQANARNPIPIVIPCHRVIGCSGKLTGFGGGIAVKQTLLDLEQQYR
ncbi:MAG TPA: methylated-DNA--[protein]-cysteine S-methyltransferase, partial [Desulfobacterales bacterium]|nr:methylated-DNA--[protein]-cysteine S-methyltransferase [Desulfobacterales bacterium]